jgi:hypothetical protein
MRKKKEETVVVQSGPTNLIRSIGEITKDAYIQYGGYVDCNRALPDLSGLKVSTRRLIYASMQHSKGQDIPTHVLVPEISRWHPHGTVGVELTASHLVRSGIFTGHGFFGYTSIDGVVSPPAATRYTKMRLSDTYWELLGDVVKPEFVEFRESPQGEPEPTYLPCPLPFALYMPIQTMGLGVGARTNIPSFSPVSLLAAYKNNDPSYLESSVDLILDKNKSELVKLWETGKGKVIYSYKIRKTKSPDGNTEGILFESNSPCATEIFIPKITRFNKLIEDGKVYIEDITDKKGPKLFVGRIPGARGVSVDDILAIARKICYSSIEYNLWITDGKSAFRIPMRDWIDYTYKNYIDLITKVNMNRIQRTNFDISVNLALPYIADYILNKNPKATDEEIMKNLGLSKDVVVSVMSKPISYLRKNKDTSDRVKALKEKLRELKKFNPVVYTDNIIPNL